MLFSMSSPYKTEELFTSLSVKSLRENPSDWQAGLLTVIRLLQI